MSGKYEEQFNTRTVEADRVIQPVCIINSYYNCFSLNYSQGFLFACSQVMNSCLQVIYIGSTRSCKPPETHHLPLIFIRTL